MPLPLYKTNRVLWFAMWLICFFVAGPGLDCVTALFSGELRFKDLTSFNFIAPSIFSIVMGWLLQCAIVIVWSWKHKSGSTALISKRTTTENH